VLRRKDNPMGGALAERVGAGKKSRVVVQYLLRNKVIVPKRPYLGISQRTAEDFGDILTKHVQAIYDEVLGK
jgi:phage gpG-like protein